MGAARNLSWVSPTDIKPRSHGAEVEIWGIAKYLSGLLKKYFVKDQCRILQTAGKWKEDTTVTAEMALVEFDICMPSLPMYCVEVWCFTWSNASFHGFGRQATVGLRPFHPILMRDLY